RTCSSVSGVPTLSAIPASTRSPLPGASTANFTDELPELSTSTRPPESWGPGALPPVAIIGGIVLGAGDARVSPALMPNGQRWPACVAPRGGRSTCRVSRSGTIGTVDAAPETGPRPSRRAGQYRGPLQRCCAAGPGRRSGRPPPAGGG